MSCWDGLLPEVFIEESLFLTSTRIRGDPQIDGISGDFVVPAAETENCEDHYNWDDGVRRIVSTEFTDAEKCGEIVDDAWK